MPELPEVETIRKGLKRRIIGLTLQRVEVIGIKILEGQTERIVKKKVLDIRRLAKVLIVELTSNLSLVFHLKMTGQLIWVGQSKNGKLIGGHPTVDMLGRMPNSSTRVIFTFSDNSKLFFNDQRRFGWVKVVPTLEVESIKFIQGLGPEPLEPEFTWLVLRQQLLKKKNMPVKVALMEQTLISGIGNIYASEACFNGGVDPRRKAFALSEAEFKKLHQGVLKSLTDGIKYGGSSRTHFVNAEGQRGLFLDYAFVYQRVGQPCKRCKTPIKRITLGGRGTFYCPSCQR